MSEKKRKATGAPESRPKKKQQIDTIASIKLVKNNDSLKPIIAGSAGPSFPHNVRFQSFSKKTVQGSEIVLHSSEHPTIDYTAAEGAESGESYLKHYVAVYDPVTGLLKVTEAKRLTVRGSIRQEKALEEEDDEENAAFAASQGTRSALTEAFGSKKSKKAVQSMAENRQLGQGIEGAMIANAITSNMTDDEDEAEFIDPSATARNSKPLPPADISTDDIEEVYSISKLVYPHPASNTLRVMPVEPWKAKLRVNTEINLRTRFVANRVGYIGKKAIEDESAKYNQQLQLLRYIELLIEVGQYCGTQDRRRKMKFVDDWPERTLSPGVGANVIKQIVNHFFPDNTPSERAMTLLRTTILALTLHIVPPSGRAGDGRLTAEPTDIQLDLALSEVGARKLYQELGCKVAPATDRDMIALGYHRIVEKRKKKTREGEAKMPKLTLAILKFPLNFPKLSMGRRAR